MAWNFSTDPEYQRKLDWAREPPRRGEDFDALSSEPGSSDNRGLGAAACHASAQERSSA